MDTLESGKTTYRIYEDGKKTDKTVDIEWTVRLGECDEYGCDDLVVRFESNGIVFFDLERDGSYPTYYEQGPLAERVMRETGLDEFYITSELGDWERQARERYEERTHG